MVDQKPKTVQELAHQVGRFPEEAFEFVRKGLSYAADRVHGPETAAHQHLQAYLSHSGQDWDDLVAQYHAGDLPEAMMSVIEEAGGVDNLNRHVGGRELCWGLRDYALHRWGMLARTVLTNWGIRRTEDFGRIVFGFIEADMMLKEPGDELTDFEDVFSFDDAFNDAYAPLKGINDGLDSEGRQG